MTSVVSAQRRQLAQSVSCQPLLSHVIIWRSVHSGPRCVLAGADVAGPSTSYAAPTPPAPRTPRRRCRGGAVRSSSELSPHLTATDKVGVVIVDHGSRKRASNDMLIEFGRLYGNLTGQEIVEIAHMEIASPTIDDAVDRCAARGATTVVVAPYFLSHGRHIQEDIPALVRQAQERHPGLRCVIAEPIGIDPLMVRLISNRVAAALVDSSATAPAVAATGDAGAGGPAHTHTRGTPRGRLLDV